MEGLIDKNFKWWNSDIDDYSNLNSSDKDEILLDNPKYDIDLLKSINKYVITLDSQQEEVNTSEINMNEGFISFVSEVRNYSISSLKNNRVVKSVQKPYLECLTTSRNANKIYKRLENSDYGIFVKDGDRYYKNDKMKSLYKSDQMKFPGSCFGNNVALTYHKTFKSVFNERKKIWDDWIVPTQFSERVYYKCKNNRYPIDATMVFIIGNRTANDIFLEILNIFS